MTKADALSHMLLGALVADGASLGVHWIYDPARISEIAKRQGGPTAFTPVDAANYENTKGYFAHSKREAGALTQYGECMYLAIQSMNQNGGRFEQGAYQSAFAARFGAGGSYQGYIDRPTRGTLENIASEKSPTGIDDDQLPALTRLAPIFARYHSDANLSSLVSAAMEITNVNDVAQEYTDVFVDLLGRVFGGEELRAALKGSADAAPAPLRASLKDALETSEPSSTDYAEKTGRACHLPMAGPLIFHILNRSDSFMDAIERNNLAGGDNAGRSLMLGAIMGMLHGIDGDRGIPLNWILSLRTNAEIWAACQELAHA